MSKNRFTTEELESFAQAVRKDGFCILKNHFSPAKLKNWNREFQPLLFEHIEREGKLKNRGANRYYVTLPFLGMWADEETYVDPDIIAICERLVGADMTMCQLATDTPLKDSEYQDIHRDAPPLFPEIKDESPSFQLAVNFPLVDVTQENGPFEVARGTHMMTKEEGLRKIESGEIKIEPVLMQLGDVMIRDVRGLHRGTPNRTSTPRPMVVVGYSRRWLYRPEVGIQIPREQYNKLSERARELLRFNSIVESVKDLPKTEVYQSFAY